MLFYKAYLCDLADPFTLNNLGFISELRGELECAKQFYTLATMQGSNTNIHLPVNLRLTKRGDTGVMPPAQHNGQHGNINSQFDGGRYADSQEFQPHDARRRGFHMATHGDTISGWIFLESACADETGFAAHIYGRPAGGQG
jgi:hypothetical protein